MTFKHEPIPHKNFTFLGQGSYEITGSSAQPPWYPMCFQNPWHPNAAPNQVFLHAAPERLIELKFGHFSQLCIEKF